MLKVAAKKPKKKWVSIRVSAETHRLYRIRAGQENCTIDELANRLIRKV